MSTVSGPIGWAPTPDIVTLYGASALTKGNLVYCIPDTTYGVGITKAQVLSQARVQVNGAVIGVALETTSAAGELQVLLRGTVEANTVEISAGNYITEGTTLIPAIGFVGSNEQFLTHVDEAADAGTTTQDSPVLAIALESSGTDETEDVGTAEATSTGKILVLFDGINKFGYVPGGH